MSVEGPAGHLGSDLLGGFLGSPAPLPSSSSSTVTVAVKTLAWSGPVELSVYTGAALACRAQRSCSSVL